MFDSEDDKTHHSAFSDAFERATGFSKAGMTLFIAWRSSLTRYCDKGGTLPELREIFDRLVAESNLNDDAAAIGGPRESANERMPPASSPQSSRSGPIAIAQPRPNSNVAPAREPSAAQIQSRDSVKAAAAETIFDTFKLRDGRVIGDVRYGELARLEVSGLVEAEVVRAIRKRGQAPHDAQVRHIIKPAVLNRIVQKAKEKHHAS